MVCDGHNGGASACSSAIGDRQGEVVCSQREIVGAGGGCWLDDRCHGVAVPSSGSAIDGRDEVGCSDLGGAVCLGGQRDEGVAGHCGSSDGRNCDEGLACVLAYTASKGFQQHLSASEGASPRAPQSVLY